MRVQVCNTVLLLGPVVLDMPHEHVLYFTEPPSIVDSLFLGESSRKLRYVW